MGCPPVTSPTPPASAYGTTANFGLKYVAQGAPAKWTRYLLEDNAKSIDAALTRGGVAPPAAQDLVTEAGTRANADTALGNRATALEGRATVLEGGVAWTALPLTGVAAVGAGFRVPQYRKIGDRVELRGAVSSSGMVNGTAFATLPAGFRPTATEIFTITADANAGRLDVTTAGQLVRQTGTGGYVTLTGLFFHTS